MTPAPSPFERFARVSGAADVAACAGAARELIGRVPRDPVDAAIAIKRGLAARGFRDDAAVFALDDMVARRAGNCLGLTLLVGATLIDRGFDVAFDVRTDPLDDVHDEGVEYVARLRDPTTGIDRDSRLPEAGDREPRFRFAPVEHASIAVRDDGGREIAFEATGLADVEVAPGWAPVAERIRRVDFDALSAAIWLERAKTALRGGDVRGALALAVTAARGDRDNREAWCEIWQAARVLGRSQLAAAAAARHAAIGGDDSLYWFTRYRMTGDATCLDRALDRLPSYADAYAAKWIASGDRRHVLIAAWMVAASDVLDLERFYRDHAEAIGRAFGRDELAAVLATFTSTRAR